MASAVAESMPPDSSTIASLMRLHYPDVSPRDDPFEDAALYDWEYRRRRDDVRFYRTLADERGGPVLDLGCGTGRLMAPLLRDGHVVVGLDHAPAMPHRPFSPSTGRTRNAQSPTASHISVSRVTVGI